LRPDPNGKAPSVSVVIRNRNEAQFLRPVLQALRLQEYPDFEVVLVDNRSSDDSVGIASAHGARICTIRDFTYGRALNVGIAAATGEVIVILSAHSLPLGPHFLTECVAPFDNEAVAAVRCVLAGKEDSTRWMEPETLGAGADMISRGPLASGCAIRRRVWQEVPFDENVTAAEDKLWAMEVVRRGHVIASPVPAFYAYLKRDLPLEKNHKELVAVAEATGVKLKYLADTPGIRVNAVLRAALIGPPAAALSVIRHELRITRLWWKST